MSTSIFVLSACSGDKALDAVVDCGDIDDGDRASLVSNHPDASMEAGSLYTGAEHEHVKAAVERFDELATVDWRIISAGFGVVRPDTVLPSYECTFRDGESVRRRVKTRGDDPSAMSKADRIQMIAGDIGIPTEIEDWLAESPDILFLVLGRDYLIAADDALSSIPDGTAAFAFAAEGTRDLIGDCEWIPSTDTEREALRTTWTKVKGSQLRNVSENVSQVDDLRALSGRGYRELSLQPKSTE